MHMALPCDRSGTGNTAPRHTDRSVPYLGICRPPCKKTAAQAALSVIWTRMNYKNRRQQTINLDGDESCNWTDSQAPYYTSAC